MSINNDPEKFSHRADVQNVVSGQVKILQKETIALSTIFESDHESEIETRQSKSNLLYPQTYGCVGASKSRIPSFFASKSLRSFLSSVCYAFVPQLLRSYFFNDHLAESRISSTSWMDGLRGWAAVAVFNLHFLYAYDHTATIGFGTTPTSHWLWQLPVFELVYDGAESVIIFFLVSGYVCSVKSLKMMTEGNIEGLWTSLAGSCFRRGMRLYFPVMCSTMIISLLAYVGAYEPTRNLFADRAANFMKGPNTEMHPVRYSTLWAEMEFWGSQVQHMLDIWTPVPTDPAIDAHLWTIVYEFHASMHLYVVLAALSRCKPWIRLTLLIIIGCWYAFVWHRWVSSLYFGGAVIAQLDVIKAVRRGSKNCLPSNSTTIEKTDGQTDTAAQAPVWQSGRRKCTNSVIFASRLCLYGLALYLVSYPMRGFKYPAPLYAWINNFIPVGWYVKSKFPKSVGTLILVALLTSSSSRKSSVWHRFLTLPVSQYLGKIMFGLYLCHGMILHLFGYAIPILVWRIIGGNDNMLQYGLGIIIGWMISFTAALWAGDVFTREVDARCARFIKWLERVCFTKA